MNKRQRERYNKLLLEKRQALLQLVKAARDSEKEGTTKEAPDLGDRALSTVIRDLSYQLTVGEREILRRVDDALDRMEKGEYGACVACGKKVTLARLDAVPWARHCIECQELQDRGEI
jgi:DnaK suppressor protein